MKSKTADPATLRNKIFTLVHKEGKSLDQILQAFSEVRSYFINRMQVERMAKASGLRTVDFVTNECLELFYNLKKGRQDIGYISKGWSDPGFRIGNILMIPEVRRPALEGAIMKIMKLCAVRGFAVTVDEKDGYAQLCLDTVVYTEGLNSAVFSQICGNLTECVDRIHDLLL
jgi:hypothetical protein